MEDQISAMPGSSTDTSRFLLGLVLLIGVVIVRDLRLCVDLSTLTDGCRSGSPPCSSPPTSRRVMMGGTSRSCTSFRLG